RSVAGCHQPAPVPGLDLGYGLFRLLDAEHFIAGLPEIFQREAEAAARSLLKAQMLDPVEQLDRFQSSQESMAFKHDLFQLAKGHGQVVKRQPGVEQIVKQDSAHGRWQTAKGIN